MFVEGVEESLLGNQPHPLIKRFPSPTSAQPHAIAAASLHNVHSRTRRGKHARVYHWKVQTRV